MVPRNLLLKAILVGLCALVMAVTLSAGLWPFSFRIANQVLWRGERDGLYFGDTGMAISSGRFSGLPTDQTAGCSLELSVEPRLTEDSSTLLSFYDASGPVGIAIRQVLDDMVFSRGAGDKRSERRYKNVFQNYVFEQGRPVQITLTSANGRLEIYLDGVLRKSVAGAELKGTDFTGILVLANTPYENLSWTGTVRGLAIYDHALGPQEVKQHSAVWRSDREMMRKQGDRPYALYLFDEGDGATLHNLGKAGPDLEIPKNYFIFDPGFLVPFWKEFRPDQAYLKDLAVNVFGLVPLGVCFAALFAWVAGQRRSLLYTTLLGLSVSLTIEIVQRFIPTRNSGSTDLITNTLGSALGAWLYLNAKTQSWLAHWGLVELKARRQESAD